MAARKRRNHTKEEREAISRGQTERWKRQRSRAEQLRDAMRKAAGRNGETI